MVPRFDKVKQQVREESRDKIFKKRKEIEGEIIVRKQIARLVSFNRVTNKF